MGKHLLARHLNDESRNKQPGCIWGLVHVLDYHRWQSNVKKLIHHRKYEGQTHDKCDWSPGVSVHGDDGYEKILSEQERPPHHGSRASRTSKRRSLGARIKAIIAEETCKEDKAAGGGGGFSAKSRSLQRTYSIHHLESVDDFFGKIRTDWNHPIIFLPRNSGNGSSKSSDAAQTKSSRGETKIHSQIDAVELNSVEEPDVFEIFKVDKEFLLKQIQDSNESIANFSRSALGLNSKGKFSKSRSFPVVDLAKSRKFKPMKLESKKTEVWSFPREEKVQNVDHKGVFGIMNKQDKQRNSGMVVPSDAGCMAMSGRRSLSTEPEEVANESQPSESLDYGEETNEVDRIGRQHEGDGIRKHAYSRSSSINESLDKYARLFENSFGKNVKLSSSQSLKLTTEDGYAPLHPKRRRSYSYADSYYSDINFEVLGDNPSGASLVVIAEDSSSDPQNCEEEEAVSLVTSHVEIKEDDTSLRLHSSNEKHKIEDILEDKSDSWENDANCSDITLKEVQDQGFVLDSDIHPQEELHCPKGKEHESRSHKLDSLIDTDDLQSLHEKHLLSSENLENHEKMEETIHPPKTYSDLDYVRHLLDRSGIATDASEMVWHATDQLFSPQLFEEVEAGWPHEEDQLDGWPDFQGCWHHQMLFDLVNEALVEIYDTSLPYYPKSLSSSCHVRPFPMGDLIIEAICSRINTLMNILPEEKQVLDSIEARDLAHDRSWMNLQAESESVALYLEEMIFNELLQELILS